jgi:DNA polymerase I-like protein with 3'-5' exonuclease and polymerase domains
MIRQNASGAMWGNDYFEVIRKDFVKAAQIARGELIVKPLLQGVEEQRKNITICRNLEDVRRIIQVISSLPDGYIISCDTETTGLDPLHVDAKLLCIQFGWKDPETGIYVAAVIPLWHRLNTYYNPSIAWRLVIPLLVSENILKIGHNFKFDYLYIYFTTGIKVLGWEFDTMLMAHALDSGIQGCLSLKTLIWDWAVDLGIGGYEDLLPKLHKPKKVKDDETEIEDEELEEVTEE